jgi:hypothetical protein
MAEPMNDPVPHPGSSTHRRWSPSGPGCERVTLRIGRGAVDGSPLRKATAVHLRLSIDNFGIQEYMKHGE